MSYKVIAWYLFTELEDPYSEIKRQKDFLSKLDVKGRIYISEEGVNAQMSASNASAEAYIEWIRKDGNFSCVDFKIHEADEHAFDRLTIKYRDQLVAMDQKIDTRLTGAHVPPKEWAKMIEEKDPDTILIDVRNDYESEVGHFDGALKPSISTFREFPGYADQLVEQYDPKKTRVMMYCTGGIRCELYSALMRERGFEEVFQLDGGVIKYGLEEGTKHWRGRLFVFDDRLVVPISEDNDEVISSCSFCKKPSDRYYNCAHMDCNELFLSCLECVEEMKGCCSEACTHAKRLRPFEPTKTPKPYRRLPKEVKDQLDS
ncbi:MAG: rhodanese-related sulfurtransferase [Simkaniaceae bacterium]